MVPAKTRSMKRRGVICAGVMGVLATIVAPSMANARPATPLPHDESSTATPPKPASSVTVRPPYRDGGLSSSYAGGSSSSCQPAPNPFGVDCTSTSSWSPEGALVSELEVDSGAQGAVVRPMIDPVHDQHQGAYLVVRVDREAPTSGIVVRVPFEVASVDVEHAASVGSSAAAASLYAFARYPGCEVVCSGHFALTLTDGEEGIYELVVTVDPPAGRLMPPGELFIVVRVDAHVRLEPVETAAADTPEAGVDLPGEICLRSGRPPLCASGVGVASQSAFTGVVQGISRAGVRANVPEIVVTFAR